MGLNGSLSVMYGDWFDRTADVYYQNTGPKCKRFQCKCGEENLVGTGGHGTLNWSQKPSLMRNDCNVPDYYTKKKNGNDHEDGC